MVNLYPQNGNFNKGVWKRLENRWAEALDEVPPKRVEIEIELVFPDGGGPRPSGVNVVEIINGGRPERYGFTNAPGGG